MTNDPLRPKIPYDLGEPYKPHSDPVDNTEIADVDQEELRGLIECVVRTRLGAEIAHAWAELHNYLFIRKEEIRIVRRDE